VELEKEDRTSIRGPSRVEEIKFGSLALGLQCPQNSGKRIVNVNMKWLKK
jgi:hypothetical protein